MSAVFLIFAAFQQFFSDIFDSFYFVKTCRVVAIADAAIIELFGSTARLNMKIAINGEISKI